MVIEPGGAPESTADLSLRGIDGDDAEMMIRTGPSTSLLTQPLN